VGIVGNCFQDLYVLCRENSKAFKAFDLAAHATGDSFFTAGFM